MKNLILPLLTFLLLIGCSKDEVTTQQSALNSVETERIQNIGKPIFDDVTKAMAEFQQILMAERARLAKTNRAKKSCTNNLQVPADFATIQEAVDNACDGAVITVKSGTYTEVVVVEKPGIKFKANGDVTLIGGFVLNEGADDITIQQFTIVVGAGNVHAINARNVTGGKIFQNTISDPAHKGGTAVRYYNGSEVTVHGNNISGTGWGVFFGSTGVDGSSHNNTISNNHITGMTFGSVIGLQGNCDNNFINENTMEDNPTVSNAGVMLYSGANVNGYCDNNVVKNNISSNGYLGAWVFNSGTNNKIGPYNTFNNNQTYGFYISGPATSNTIFNNTAQGNVFCDIVNLATDLLSNTFKNNTAICTQGL
ncbi:hypothetical protein GVN20_05365 [Runella sp. CRIBMP]|uniref:right-handed parallel beta-helix repeat-containing protein n=1 Tax=Runella sp. CRIBMP TaxID=2683261 RepID=UPI00141260B3|nr:right-handed parallel beta-helix repeat-containing protein [Runella sp. CRIBMP]NBB18780.1 hypothetical protein [Runella sp. CRIBMP]